MLKEIKINEVHAYTTKISSLTTLEEPAFPTSDALCLYEGFTEEESDVHFENAIKLGFFFTKVE